MAHICGVVGSISTTATNHSIENSRLRGDSLFPFNLFPQAQEPINALWRLASLDALSEDRGQNQAICHRFVDDLFMYQVMEL